MKKKEKEQTDPLAAADCKEEDDGEEGRSGGEQSAAFKMTAKGKMYFCGVMLRPLTKLLLPFSRQEKVICRRSCTATAV